MDDLKENYVSRAKVIAFIDEELKSIESKKGEMNDALLGGLEAAYRCMKEAIESKYI